MPWKLSALAAFCMAAAWPLTAAACPFCPAVGPPFLDRIATSDAAVLAELVKFVSQPSDSDAALSEASSPFSNRATGPKSTFRVLKIYRGAEHVKVGDTLQAQCNYKGANGGKALLTATEPKALQWSPAVEMTPRGLDYLEKLRQLPPGKIERLDFCQAFLEDTEIPIQEDAFNEFATADYATVRLASPRYDRARLLSWIQNPATPETRLRLYFTLLGTCGTKQDADTLEAAIRSGDATRLRGLDAMLACYLTLGGPTRLPLVEELFLKKKDAEYSQVYAAVMAIRFHGQEADIIPRPRAIEALRCLLDRPQLADLVIPDLARWEDWDSIDRMVELFKSSTKEWSYVRVPIIHYLRACPRPEAKTKLDELAKLDPDAFRRAATFFPFGGGVPVKKPATEGAAKQEPAGAAKPNK